MLFRHISTADLLGLVLRNHASYTWKTKKRPHSKSFPYRKEIAARLTAAIHSK